jgi:hypothetical protein
MNDLQFIAYCSIRGIPRDVINAYLTKTQQEYYTEYDFRIIVTGGA